MPQHYIKILNKITYWWDHILAEAMSMPQCQLTSFKYWTRSHTYWGHIDNMTSAEIMHILDNITYILRAHWHHNISRDHSDENTYKLRENGGHNISLIQSKTMRTHTGWGHINTTTSAEFIQRLNKEYVLPKGTSTPQYQLSSFKY